jgi:hypothetical protein
VDVEIGLAVQDQRRGFGSLDVPQGRALPEDFVTIPRFSAELDVDDSN